MTNRVDFYQAGKQGLAVPAGGAFVFVEGKLCPYLEVVEIVKSGKGEFGSARMTCHTIDMQTRDGSPCYIDDEIEIGGFAKLTAIGKEVSIRWIYNSLYPAGGSQGLVIFAGQVEKLETTLGPDGEYIEVVARDFSAALERITVFGKWGRDIDGRVVFIESARMVFNESGQPNASSELIERKGNSVRLFAANTTGARLWSCADVIRHLLCEYLPSGQLALPEEERLLALAGGEQVRDLDVTGLSLLEAIERCCEQAGLDFKFVPRLGETGPSQAIVFYRKGCGRSVELNLQQPGQRLSVSKTNIWKASSERFGPVTHRYIGLGDYKVFEATFNLIKGWPWYDEDVDYEKFSPSTNPEFYKVKDTWRK